MSAPWPTLSVAPNIDRPPWGWNPVNTFLTAYTTVQENQRAQESAAMDAELSRILLPEKAAKAAFNIKQLAYESKLLEKSYKTAAANYDERLRVISSSGGSAAADADSTGPTDASKRSDLIDISGFNLPTANRPTTSGKVKLPDDL